MSQPGDPVFDYLTGQLHPSQPPLLAAFEREGEAAVARLQPRLDLPYGPHPRQRFDLFKAAAARATLVYFHAGYWQARDKAQFRFIAPPFVAAALNVALVNYPLCPEVTLAALTEAVRASLSPILVAAGAHPLVVSGHSAGGHLAVELAATDWAERGLTAPPIAGVAALSGVYDLVPLLETPLNAKLGLDRPAAQAASPLGRLPRGLPPAVFAVGGAETAAFIAQSRAIGAAWTATGAEGRALVVPEADHFSLLRAFTDLDGALFQATIALSEASR